MYTQKQLKRKLGLLNQSNGQKLNNPDAERLSQSCIRPERSGKEVETDKMIKSKNLFGNLDIQQLANYYTVVSKILYLSNMNLYWSQ